MSHIRRITIATLTAAAVMTGAVAGEMVWRSGRTVVRLQDKPCGHPKVQALVKDEFRDKLRHAEVAVQGRHLGACWLVAGEAVVLIDEDGEGGEIPIRQFRFDPGV